MAESIKSWISGIAVTAIIISIVQGIMPKGSVKRIAAVICSAALIAAMAAPVLKWSIPDIHKFRREGDDLTRRYMENLSNANFDLNQSIIEAECESYILDKAKNLGANVSVNVTAEYIDSDTCVPMSAEIFSSCSPLIRTALSEYMSDELGIPEDMQTWRGADEEQ